MREGDIMIGQPDSIVLTGDAAEKFANSLFRPTSDEIERRNAVMKKIDREIKITEHEDGFSAEVSWLDLSFLDEEKKYPNYVEFALSVPFNPQRRLTHLIEAKESVMSIFMGAKSSFGNAEGSDILSCAA